LLLWQRAAWLQLHYHILQASNTCKAIPPGFFLLSFPCFPGSFPSSLFEFAVFTHVMADGKGQSAAFGQESVSYVKKVLCHIKVPRMKSL
jgi:hypothetical protein